MDIEIRKFRGQLVSIINSAQLPMEVKRLVVADVLTELSRSTDELITQLLQEHQKKSDAVKEKEEKDEPVT